VVNIVKSVAQPLANAAPRPLVTIIIPVYNGANYLAEAVRSALSQTYRPLDVVVVNDGSCDGGETARVARSFGDLIRYIEQPNGGIAAALNCGIMHAAGQYVSWLSHDDLYEPTKIHRQVERLLEHGTEAVVFCDYRWITESGESLGCVHIPPNATVSMRCFLTHSCDLHGCTLLMPRGMLLTAGGFSSSFIATQDYNMWFDLAGHTTFLHVPECLVKVRHHPLQATIRLLGVARKEQDDMFQRFLDTLTREEVEAYSKGEPAEFFMRVYVNSRLTRLPGTSIKALRYLRETIAKKHTVERLKAQTRLGLMNMLWIPMRTLRTAIRNTLLACGQGWLVDWLRRPFGRSASN
jgi:glycosyltransferase involved in cell wall biosynthesis